MVFRADSPIDGPPVGNTYDPSVDPEVIQRIAQIQEQEDQRRQRWDPTWKMELKNQKANRDMWLPGPRDYPRPKLPPPFGDENVTEDPFKRLPGDIPLGPFAPLPDKPRGQNPFGPGTTNDKMLGA